MCFRKFRWVKVEEYKKMESDIVSLKKANKSLSEMTSDAIKDLDLKTAEIVGLEKQIKALEEEIEDLKSDRYLVRKVRATKPTKQVAKTKARKTSNQIESRLKELSEL